MPNISITAARIRVIISTVFEFRCAESSEVRRNDGIKNRFIKLLRLDIYVHFIYANRIHIFHI